MLSSFELKNFIPFFDTLFSMSRELKLNKSYGHFHHIFVLRVDRFLCLCSHAKAFEQCFTKIVSKTNCNQKSINAIESFGYDIIGSKIRSFCGQYFENNDKCFKLVAKTPKLNHKTYVRPKSIFLPLISLLESYRNLKCNKNTEKRMDRLMADLIIVGTDKLMPENEIQLKEYCSKITQNMGFIYGYVDSCISPFGQTVAKIMTFTAQKQFEGICKPGKLTNKANKMLSATACGNRARDKLKICMDNMIDAIVGTALAPINSRILMTCCHSNAMRQCYRDATESTDGCTQRTIDWTENFILDSIGGPVRLGPDIIQGFLRFKIFRKNFFTKNLIIKYLYIFENL